MYYYSITVTKRGTLEKITLEFYQIGMIFDEYSPNNKASILVLNHNRCYESLLEIEETYQQLTENKKRMRKYNEYCENMQEQIKKEMLPRPSDRDEFKVWLSKLVQRWQSEIPSYENWINIINPNPLHSQETKSNSVALED